MALVKRLRACCEPIADEAADHIDALQSRLAEAERQRDALKAGNCIKCGMGPARQSCAYPEACEHPGRVAALERNRALMELSSSHAARVAAEQALGEQERIRRLHRSGRYRSDGEAEALRAALKNYGQHKLSCDKRKQPPSNFQKNKMKCTCGLDAALTARPSDAEGGEETR